MQRFFGPVYVTGIVWFGMCSWGTRWMPYWLTWFLSWIATLICWMLLWRVRRGISSNLNVILGETSWIGRELRIYRTLRMFSLITIDRYTLFRRRHLLEVEVDREDRWHEAFDTDRGCVLVSAHLGNWEVASLVPASIEKHMHVVREREVDVRSQELLEKLYENHASPNFTLHYAGDDSSLGANLLLALRRGGVVGLAGDQPRTGQSYVEVEMFGRPTPVPHGPAALARAAEVSILPVFGVRVGAFHYRLMVGAPIRVPRTEDRHRDILEATQAFATEMEAVIREHPHSWFCWWPRWP